MNTIQVRVAVTFGVRVWVHAGVSARVKVRMMGLECALRLELGLGSVHAKVRHKMENHSRILGLMSRIR